MQKSRIVAAGVITGAVFGIAGGLGLSSWRGDHADHLREVSALAGFNDEQVARIATSYCEIITSPSGTAIDTVEVDNILDSLAGQGWSEQDTLRMLDESVQWKCPDLVGAEELHQQRLEAEK